MRKIAIIVVRLVTESDSIANEKLEAEMLNEMPMIPYVAEIEKITILDCR